MKRRALLSGRVIHGDGQGRKIGYPTANLDDKYFRSNPQPRGVFASFAWANGRRYASVSVVGVPDRHQRAKIETHLLDFEGDLYGRELTVQLVKRIRPLQWYATRAGLLRKIAIDVRAARRELAGSDADARRKLRATFTAGREVERGMRSIRRILRPGRTELDVRDDLLRIFRNRAPSFPFIVAAGPSSAFMHHAPTRRKLRRGEMVMVDLGISVEGWCSDLTRTFHLGPPTPLFRQRYTAVLDAQRRGLDALRAFAGGRMVDAAVRDRLKQRKMHAHFVHSTGHGVGRRIHEPPSLGPKSVDLLLPDDLVTVEPGIYLPGWGGIRIEDMALVHASSAKVLTSAISSRLADIVID